MIQRIQSVYLLLGSVAITGDLFFMSMWRTPASEVHSALPWMLVGVSVVAGAGGIGSIFLYSDRERQRTAVQFIQWLTVAYIAGLYGSLWATNFLGVFLVHDLSLGSVLTLVLPVVSYGLFFMARRAIERDIELVRSVDRIR